MSEWRSEESFFFFLIKKNLQLSALGNWMDGGSV